MAIFLNNDTRLIVQGITGKEGSFHAKNCQEYGTKLVGGVTPNKGGTEILNVPVFNTVKEAVNEVKPNTSMIFVPAKFAANAIIEALNLMVASDELPDIDYRLVRDDLNAVISQMPEFAQAYYNRGNVSAKLNDFKSAVVDYSKAIELNDKLAGAFFNRGLARIYMGNTAEGIADLSKAGELGIYSAYNVIKRFQNRDE